jgi:phage gpG-like protein
VLLMATDVSIRWNEANLRRFLGGGGDLDKAMGRAAGRIRDRAKVNLTTAGLVDTGLLRQSIRHEQVKADGQEIIWLVGTSVPYGKYHEFGTGPWIYPRRAKVLRFWPRGGNAYVFAKRVRGVPETAFLRRAAEATTSLDFLV